jgi:hypothetical protein
MSEETRVSVLEPSGDAKVNILIALLQQNREEIRFWQALCMIRKAFSSRTLIWPR